MKAQAPCVISTGILGVGEDLLQADRNECTGILLGLLGHHPGRSVGVLCYIFIRVEV